MSFSSSSSTPRYSNDIHLPVWHPQQQQPAANGTDAMHNSSSSSGSLVKDLELDEDNDAPASARAPLLPSQSTTVSPSAFSARKDPAKSQLFLPDFAGGQANGANLNARAADRLRRRILAGLAALSTLSTALAGLLVALLVVQNSKLLQLQQSLQLHPLASSSQNDSVSYATRPAQSLLTGRKYSQEFLDFTNDVVLTVKTGGAVFFSRLPIHLLDEESSIRLINNTLFFADFEANINGLQIHDVLANMSNAVHRQEQFQAYFTLQHRIANGEAMTDSPNGWDLDKYKFLPLHGQTYRAFPDAKFTIHIEADTYLIQEGLLRWLFTLDPDEPIMSGSVVLINDLAFPHGGSGYVLSRGVLKQTWGKDPYLEYQYDEFVRDNCCGDYVLADVVRHLTSVDGPNIDSHHFFQGNPPSDIDFHRDNICDPIFTFHHVTAEDSHRLFAFEREMYSKLPASDFIRYIDVYDHFIPSFLQGPASGAVHRVDWDNNANDRHETISEDDSVKKMDAHECARRCNAWNDCLIWSLREGDNGPECRLADRVIFGKSAERVQSGWMTTRIEHWLKSKECYERFSRPDHPPLMAASNDDAKAARVYEQ